MLKGNIYLKGDKSISHRIVIFGSLANEKSKILSHKCLKNLLEGNSWVTDSKISIEVSVESDTFKSTSQIPFWFSSRELFALYT